LSASDQTWSQNLPQWIQLFSRDRGITITIK
jgi:hypothetical protein